jgi:hypothetical protein
LATRLQGNAQLASGTRQIYNGSPNRRQVSTCFSSIDDIVHLSGPRHASAVCQSCIDPTVSATSCRSAAAKSRRLQRHLRRLILSVWLRGNGILDSPPDSDRRQSTLALRRSRFASRTPKAENCSRELLSPYRVPPPALRPRKSLLANRCGHPKSYLTGADPFAIRQLLTSLFRQLSKHTDLLVRSFRIDL